MNQFECVETYYIRASRTIEIVRISNSQNSKKLCFIYNYEGNYFRLFKNFEALKSFFLYGHEPDNTFEKEQLLDDFLQFKIFL